MQLFITNGVDLSTPPLKVPPLQHDEECHINYRSSPFIIQAACAGNVDSMKKLVAAGCSLTEVGHICLSRRRQNSVASNVIGAAAYHGHKDMLVYLLNRVDQGLIDVKAMETADRFLGKGSAYKPEINDFTPLQLAIVSPDSDLGVIKVLFGKEANHMVKESSTGNNILHLAARYCSNPEVLEYVVKNAKIDIFERNNAGDTPLTIVQALQNTRAIQIFEECQDLYDDSAQKTDELMAELLGEDEKNEKARQKKKEKKHRSKLQKLADKNNCSIEELE